MYRMPYRVDLPAQTDASRTAGRCRNDRVSEIRQIIKSRYHEQSSTEQFVRLLLGR